MFAFVSVFAAIVAAVLFASNHFRNNVDDEPAEWHADPLTAESTGKPNWYRLVPDDASVDRDPKRDGHPPTFDVSAGELGAAFDAVATSDDRVEVLAGSAAAGHVTYVQRSAVFAFPDYISTRFIENPDGGSTLAVYSRARFGRSDLGVNEKRVARWVDGVTKHLR